MSVFSETEVAPRNEEAERVRRLLRQSFDRLEASMEEVHRIYATDPAGVRTALGTSAVEAEHLYQAIRGFVSTYRETYLLPLPPVT